MFYPFLLGGCSEDLCAIIIFLYTLKVQLLNFYRRHHVLKMVELLNLNNNILVHKGFVILSNVSIALRVRGVKPLPPVIAKMYRRVADKAFRRPWAIEVKRRNRSRVNV